MDFHVVLLELHNDKQWSMSGDTYEGLTWLDESPKPTEELLRSQYSEALQISLNKKRVTEIKKQLEEIDLKTIRPLRDNEMDRLAELEGQANTLRQEMRALLA